MRLGAPTPAPWPPGTADRQRHLAPCQFGDALADGRLADTSRPGHGADAAVLYDGEQPGDMADLGLGVIDFPTIFKAHQVEEYIVENDTPDFSPAATANTGFRYLDGLDF